MPRAAIEQGTCTNCGESEDNYMVDARAVRENKVEWRANCDCGETAGVAVNEDGIAATTDNLSLDGASWNESDEDENA